MSKRSRGLELLRGRIHFYADRVKAYRALLKYNKSVSGQPCGGLEPMEPRVLLSGDTGVLLDLSDAVLDLTSVYVLDSVYPRRSRSGSSRQAAEPPSPLPQGMSAPGAPTVTDVLVSSTDWSSSILNAIDPVNGLGYSIPVGGGDQLLSLKWNNIDKIVIRFSEDVSVSAGDLSLRGVGVTGYAFLPDDPTDTDPDDGFRYDPSTSTATWTLQSPIVNDKLLIHLPDTVLDTNSEALDGEWDNPSNVGDPIGSSFASGDGEARGDFNFRFNVLPGDATGDGITNGLDLLAWQSQLFNQGPDKSADFNTDGIVNGLDLLIWQANLFNSLPVGEPTPLSLFEDPDLEAAVIATLNLPAGNTVKSSDLVGLKSLTADSNLIDSLVGLEQATNLQSLTLQPGDFSDPGHLSSLAPLSGLNSLTTLSLQRAGLDSAELATLGSLASLEELDLRYNQITDLSFIAGLASVDTLLIYGNDVTDAVALTGKLIQTDLPPVGLQKAADLSELASALYYLPARILEYALNTFEYEPYSGAMKGAQAVFETQAGNDWDQASFLATLLGEAGVATRYVTGRVEAPIQQAMDYVGATDEGAAGLILANAGLNPISIVDGNGEVVDIRFDHTWLEAQLTVPGESAQWLAMDPSWKFRDFQDGLADLLTLVPFDESAYLSQTRKELVFEFYEDQVRQYLAINQPGVSVADVPYDGPIIPQKIDTIPDSLPYTVLGPTTLFSAVPDTMKYRVGVTLRQGGATLFSTVLGMPENSLSRMTVSFSPAGAGLVTPEFRLDGQVFLTGSTVPIGSGVQLVLDHYDPGDNAVDRSFTYDRDAGQYIAIGLDGRQVSRKRVTEAQRTANEAAIAKLNSQPFDQDDLVGGLLDLTITKWFYDTNAGEDAIDALTHAVPVFDSVASGIATSETTVNFFPDLQNPYVPDGMSVDVANNFYQSFALDGNTTHDLMRDIMAGHNDSAQEHAIIEELVNIESISTIKSLQLANERGIPVFVIDNGNRNTFVPQLNLSASVISAVNTELNAGATVTIPRDETPLNDWQGVGYITRKITANGSQEGYIISGGLNTASGDHEPVFIQGGAGTGDPNTVFIIDPNTGEWVQVYVGDPINIANGNVKRDEVDISLPGIGIPLVFGRSYDSMNTTDRGMGPGWSFTYSDRLTFETDGSITWLDDTGNHLKFTPDGVGGFDVGGSIFGTFTDTGSGFIWRDTSGTERVFDTAGKLVRIEDRYGNGYAVAYDVSDQITTVSDLIAPSRQFIFTYTSGLITSIADFTGRLWSYDYTNGLLSKATAPFDAATLKAEVQYEYYTDPTRDGLLKQVTLPNTGTIQYEYYANRRGFRLTDPEGFSHSLSYNTFRNQTAFTDERGHTTFYTHNDEGNLIEVVYPDMAKETNEWVDSLLMSATDAFGQVETFEYDALGNMTRNVDRGGFETTFTYEPTYNQPLDITRPGGRVTTFTYDGAGNLTSIEDAEGNTTTMAYDARGQILTRTAPKGTLTPAAGDFTIAFTYNDAGNILTRSTDLPSQETYTYDSRGNLLAHEDVNQRTTTYVYDLLDRLVNQTDPLNQIATLAYDTMGNLVSITDELSRTTSFEYDLRQSQIRTTNPDATYQTGAYNSAGNAVSDFDELGRATHYVFDQRDRLVATQFADGATQLTVYDGGDRAIRTTDPVGNETRFTYDSLDRLIATSDALNQATVRQYDAVGNLTFFTDQLNRTTEFRYDLIGQQTESIDPLNNTTFIAYDPNGNVESITDPLSHVTQYSYDVLNRRVEVLDAENRLIVTAYDTLGNVLSITDPENNTTTFSYDELDRRKTETNQLSQLRTFDYDAVGNLTSIINRNGLLRQFVYDPRDRQTSETWLDAQDLVVYTSTKIYDAAGQLLSASDPSSTYIHTYDTVGRVTAISNAIGDVPPNTAQTQIIQGQLELGDGTLQPIGSFLDVHTINVQEGEVVTIDLSSGAFDAFLVVNIPGQQFQDDNSGGGTDAQVQITATASGQWQIWATTLTAGATGAYDLQISTLGAPPVQIVDGMPHVVFDYDYDLAGNLLSTKDSSGGVVGYAFDGLNRPITLTQSGQGVSSKRVDFGYDAAGQQSDTTRYADLSGTSLVAASTFTFDDAGRLTDLSHARNATPLADYTWVFDNASRITQMTTPDGTSTLAYDNTDQITSATHTFQSNEAYTYDDNGNRTNAGYVTGTNNRLESDGVYNYQYDAEGNRTLRTEIATGETAQYEWDYRNRLTRIVVRDSANDVIKDIKYTYDVFGRRIAKSIDEDGQGPTSPTVEHYVYDGDNIAVQFDEAGDLTHRYLHGPGVDQILADEKADGSVLWMLTDHQGTARDLIDSAGAVQNHIEYDSFGNVTAESNPVASTIYGFTGRERDAESDLNYYRARYYDPGAGRFISEDPAGFIARDTNLSRYVGNNPVGATDPSGLASQNISDSGVEAPGFWEGLIPIWGSGKTAINNFQEGRWGWGLINTGLAISDVFLVKSLVTAGIKLVGKGTAKAVGREAAESITTGNLTKAEILAQNRIAGKAAERRAAELLTQEGNTILGSQVSIRTSQGRRVIDHLIQTADGRIIAVEVKSGNAVRSASQLAKDSAIASEGGVLIGKNAPDALRGQNIVIETIERRMP